MSKSMSRPARWADACSRMRSAISDFDDAMGELESLQEEYQSWLDNLPEMAQGTALEEKLQAVCDLSLSDRLEDNLDIDIDELEGIDLPRGFGRD